MATELIVITDDAILLKMVEYIYKELIFLRLSQALIVSNFVVVRPPGQCSAVIELDPWLAVAHYARPKVGSSCDVGHRILLVPSEVRF